MLRGAEFYVDEGEAVAILGPNGVGKSTLLGSVVGLFPPRAGEVRLGDRNVTRLPPDEMARRGVALVPERRQLFGSLTVRDNLLLGAYCRYGRDRRTLGADVDRVLELFPGLGGYLGRPAGLLSGGEQQMVAIGRGLLARPRVLLLDEPSLGLAPIVRTEIFRALRRLVEEGTTMVLVEQNLRAAVTICRRAYVMERGRMVFSGTTADVAAAHQSGYLDRPPSG